MSQTKSMTAVMYAHPRSFVAILLVMGLCFWKPLAAQYEAQQPYENDASTLRSVMTPDVDATQVKTQLQALLESTRKARRDRARKPQAGVDSGGLRDSSAARNVPSAENNAAAPNAERMLDVGAGIGVDTGKPDSVQSIDEIRERIRILQRLRRDRMMMDEAARDQAVANPAVPVMSNVPLNDANEEASNNAGLDEQVSPSLDAAVDAESVSTEVPIPPAVTSGNSVTGSQVLPQPANTFALGQSLFRTGNYESALKSFRAAEAASLSPSERTWLDLLIALCEHRLGRTSEAMGRLREVANTKSSDYPIRVSKWWLQHAEASNETKVKWDALSSELNLLAERINEQ
ncbi:MAG: hypothetical protein AAF802_12470 [Planctomycetota bacterium]